MKIELDKEIAAQNWANKVKILIIVGVIVGIALLVIIICCCRKRKRHATKRLSRSEAHIAEVLDMKASHYDKNRGKKLVI